MCFDVFREQRPIPYSERLTQTLDQPSGKRPKQNIPIIDSQIQIAIVKWKTRRQKALMDFLLIKCDTWQMLLSFSLGFHPRRIFRNFLLSPFSFSSSFHSSHFSCTPSPCVILFNSPSSREPIRDQLVEIVEEPTDRWQQRAELELRAQYCCNWSNFNKNQYSRSVFHLCTIKIIR